MRRRAGRYDRPVNFAEHPVIASLTPVFLLIGAGFLAGRRNWIRDSAVKDLSNLVFLLLIPSLLFRTMSSVRFEQLDLRPIAAYFPAALLLLCGSIAWRGFNRGSVVRALAGTFSNMVMIGITLVGLAYGQAGLVTLLTLVSVHALILLTLGSVVLELAVAREARAGGQRAPHVLETAWSAFKGALIHPIPLPILCGLLYAQTGWGLPAVVDKPLQLLGSAFGPIALVLVGVTLARTPLRGQQSIEHLIQMLTDETGQLIELFHVGLGNQQHMATHFGADAACVGGCGGVHGAMVVTRCPTARSPRRHATQDRTQRTRCTSSEDTAPAWLPQLWRMKPATAATSVSFSRVRKGGMP